MNMMRVLTLEEMGQVSGGYYSHQLVIQDMWDDKDAPGGPNPGPGGPGGPGGPEGGPAPAPGGGGRAPGVPSEEQIRDAARRVVEESEKGNITWKIYGKVSSEQDASGNTTKKAEVGFEIGGSF